MQYTIDGRYLNLRIENLVDLELNRKLSLLPPSSSPPSTPVMNTKYMTDNITEIQKKAKENAPTPTGINKICTNDINKGYYYSYNSNSGSCEPCKGNQISNSDGTTQECKCPSGLSKINNSNYCGCKKVKSSYPKVTIDKLNKVKGNPTIKCGTCSNDDSTNVGIATTTIYAGLDVGTCNIVDTNKGWIKPHKTYNDIYIYKSCAINEIVDKTSKTPWQCKIDPKFSEKNNFKLITDSNNKSYTCPPGTKASSDYKYCIVDCPVNFTESEDKLSCVPSFTTRLNTSIKNLNDKDINDKDVNDKDVNDKDPYKYYFWKKDSSNLGYIVDRLDTHDATIPITTDITTDITTTTDIDKDKYMLLTS